MDQTSRNVLDAADKWLAAVRAITTASEAEERNDNASAQIDLDEAEVELVAAVMDWRVAGRPD